MSPEQLAPFFVKLNSFFLTIDGRERRVLFHRRAAELSASTRRPRGSRLGGSRGVPVLVPPVRASPVCRFWVDRFALAFLLCTTGARQGARLGKQCVSSRCESRCCDAAARRRGSQTTSHTSIIGHGRRARESAGAEGAGSNTVTEWRPTCVCLCQWWRPTCVCAIWRASNQMPRQRPRRRRLLPPWTLVPPTRSLSRSGPHH